LQDLDFDREQLKVVQGKVKDRYVPLSKHLIRGLKTYIEAEKPKRISQRTTQGIAGGDFDSRYSQRGVQWQSNKPVKQLGLPRRFVCIRLAHFATHLLEDGLDIITLKNLLDMKI
jgi:site-specific recombinase XerD